MNSRSEDKNCPRKSPPRGTPSDQELRVVSAIGTAFPSHCTAHGKALLAELDPKELDSLHRGIRLEKRTPSTLDSTAKLRENLQHWQSVGVSVNLEEHAIGVCGIGVALRLGLSERYALSLAVPSLRSDENREALTNALLQCKAEIEAVIGVP